MEPKGEFCAIISAEGLDAAKSQIEQAHEFGAGLIELRMDLILGNSLDVEKLANKAHALGLACIVTYRDKEDAGKFEGKDKEPLILDAIGAGTDFVDIELGNAKTIGATKDCARKAGCKIIASWHCFGKPPALSEMEKKIQLASDAGADVAKIAFVAEKGHEKVVDALFLKAKQLRIALVVSPMGDCAAASRAYALSKGSAFAYCTVGKAQGIAHGVPTIEQLKKAVFGQTVK